jgi:aspartyl-tRNA(Asn)/glutamyl-tRNA(Gln) amidotransferase subunit A
VSDKTRQLFRDLARRIRDYRVSNQAVSPSFVPSQAALGTQPLQRAGEPRRAPFQTIANALRRQQRGEVTAVDLVKACVEVANRLNPKLNAFVNLMTEQALAAAGGLDAARKAGRPMGALHGIPIAVKDIVDVAGVRTTASSRVRASAPPAKADAPAVQRLREAGAIVIGKTHTHEFALGVSTPQSRNPWDAQRLAGGSSGGSAIAVAAGMALGSVNTDTRGSIRVPSALCGVVGLKATFGTVPKRGVITLSWTMDHVGPITRSTEDAARMLDVMAGHDAHDPFSQARPEVRYADFLGQPVKDLRIGIPDQMLIDVHPEVENSFQESLRMLEDLGARVTMLKAPDREDLTLCSAAGLIVGRCEAAAYHQPTLGDGSLYTPDVFAQLDEASKVSAVDYIQALRYRSEFMTKVDEELRNVDVLAMPTIPIPAPLAAEAESVMVLLARNCIPWSFGWYPTLNLPTGLTKDGLPISIQFVGPRYGEGRLLALGSAFEDVVGFEYPQFH